jgi:hypothetical protein
VRRNGPPWWLFGVVAALAVLGLLASALLLFARPSDADLRDSALLAARSYTTTLTTYDARTLDEDVQRVLRVSAEEFRGEYEQTIDEVREQIQNEQAIASGSVVGAGIEKLERDRATVVVLVDQEITFAGQEPRTEANRVRMVLVRERGSWFIGSVERL